MKHGLILLDRQLHISTDIAKSVVLDGKTGTLATEVMRLKSFGDVWSFCVVYEVQ